MEILKSCNKITGKFEKNCKKFPKEKKEKLEIYFRKVLKNFRDMLKIFQQYFKENVRKF